MTVFPFLVDDLESDVLIRRSSLEDDGRDLGLVLVLDDHVRRCFLVVDKIRVEDAGLTTIKSDQRTRTRPKKERVLT